MSTKLSYEQIENLFNSGIIDEEKKDLLMNELIDSENEPESDDDSDFEFKSVEGLYPEHSEVEILELKAKHGSINVLFFETGHKAYVRNPERRDLSSCTQFATGSKGKVDQLKFNELLLKSIWICGDECIKTDSKLLLSASAKVQELIEIVKVKIKKY